MAPTAAVPEQVKAAAREWFVRTVLETPSPQTQAEFELWQAGDPVHATAYERYLSIWRDSAQLTDLAHLANRSRAPSSRVVRGVRGLLSAPQVRWAAAAAVLGVAAVITWQYYAARSVYFTTGTAETRELSLPDGTHVVLGAKSELELSFDRHDRRVTLAAGEAFFDVAHDTLRPFVVTIGTQQVRVLGTSFDIRRASGDVRICVLAGVVQVGSPNSSTPAVDVRTVREGQEVEAELGSSKVSMANPISTPDPLAWRRGRLVYVDAPLREVLADANRYSKRQYVVQDDRLAEVRVSVSYEIAKVDQMVAGLAQALPLKIERLSDQESHLVPTEAGASERQ